MGDRPTLILTTRLGVRPLGVRGAGLATVCANVSTFVFIGWYFVSLD